MIKLSNSVKGILLSFLASLLVLFDGRAESAIPPEIPLRDFFRNPETAGYQLSPSGESIAFLKSVDSRMNVWIQPRAGGEAKQITHVKDRDVAGYFWKGDKYIAYLKDNGGDENFHVYVAASDGSQERDLTPFEGVRADIIDDLRDNPTEMIVALNKRKKEIFDAFRLNVESGELQSVAENPGSITDWVTDHDGNVRVGISTDGVNTSLVYRKTDKEPWKTIITTSFKEKFTPEFFTFDNENLYGISNIGRDTAAAVVFDLDGRKETKVLYENPDVDVAGLTYSRKRKVLLTASYSTWKQERKFFDPVIERIFKTVQEKIPGFEVGFVSTNKDEDLFVVRALNDRTRPVFYLYDVKSGDLTKLADSAPWLRADDLAEVKPIEYKSRDGLTIHGYLTLPKGRVPKNLPVVVNPHGGPWARDQWGFDPETQFLANRGFAVLQMNFRGSTGYGR
jgi:dipeptidyl aminopeptidase/acylaminoacyl peptidase